MTLLYYDRSTRIHSFSLFCSCLTPLKGLMEDGSVGAQVRGVTKYSH